MSETLLAALPSLGLPVMSLVIALGALGVPMMPASLMLLVSGTLVAAGDLPLIGAALTALLTATFADNLGYALGRFSRGRFISQHNAGLNHAKALLYKRGGMAVFLTRWLLAPLGPPMNLVAGAAGMRWRRFFAWDLAGEIVWVTGYMTLGAGFAPFVPQISDMAGNLTALLACLTIAWFVWMLLRRNQRDRKR